MKQRLLSFILAMTMMLTLVNPVSVMAEGSNKFIEVNTEVTDNLSTSGEVDKFYFSVDEYGAFEIQLNYDTEGTYTTELYYVEGDGTLKKIQTGTFNYSGSTVDGRLTKNANVIRYAPGDYYVYVKKYNYGSHSDSDYILNVQFTEEVGSYEKQPNGESQLATIIDTNTIVTGNLDTSSDVDYYKFSITEYGKIQVQFRYDHEGTYTTKLYKVGENGELISIQTGTFNYSNSTADGFATEYANAIRQCPGDYYLRVEKYNYGSFINSDYEMTILFTEEIGDYEKQPNGESQKAQLIDTNRTITGNLDSSSDEDYYYVSLDRNASLQVLLGYDTTGSYEVRVYSVSSNGSLESLINDFFYDNSSSQRVSQNNDPIDVPAGNYYILLKRYNYGSVTNEDYTLTIVSDVMTNYNPSSWAVPEVDSAIEEGLVPEHLQGEYTDSITRAEFCTLVVTMLSTKTGQDVSSLLDDKGVEINTNAFTDTADFNVLAANALGIVTGKGNGIFDPTGYITRQEAAVMLYRMSKVLGVEEGNTDSLSFNDMSSVESWATEGVTFVSSTMDSTTGRRVMGGVGDNMFSPNSSYSREQSYLTIIRLFRAF